MSGNGFFEFMLEVKKREESNGKTFPRGLTDVQTTAGVEWEKLTANEKEFYKNKAKHFKFDAVSRSFTRSRRKQQKQKSTASKSTEIVDELFSKEPDARFFDSKQVFDHCREKDRRDLDAVLTWSLGVATIEKSILYEPFYCFGVQNYYETDDHECCPAEIAMVKFSLHDGILRQYHAILKPIRIPQEIFNSAEIPCSASHGITPNCPPMGARNDYRPIVNEIKKFYDYLNTAKTFRAFVLKDQFNSAQGAVKALREETGSKYFIPYERILCVEDLAVVLAAFKNQVADLNGFADVLLGDTNWDEDPSTFCKFHNKIHSKHCALAIARKTCYVLFRSLKNCFDLSLTANHSPFPSTALKVMVEELEIEQDLIDFESDVVHPSASTIQSNCTATEDLNEHFQAMKLPDEGCLKIVPGQTEDIRPPREKSMCAKLMEIKRARQRNAIK